jgi:hypothetical protein
MNKLTLLTKIKSDYQLKKIAKALRLEFEGLEVKVEILGIAGDRWAQIAISGEDEVIATNYVIKEIGLCPKKLEKVKKNSTLNGYIRKIGKDKEELFVDVGVFQPEVVYAIMPLRRLQLQLLDGKKIDIKRIADLFCLREDLLINVKIVDVNKEEAHMEAELSSRQIRQYKVWQESLLDRLIIIGSSFNEIKATLKHARLDRDVIDVETLGMREYALTCKLGTDAAGLIPKIGRKLKSAKFFVFNPRKIRAFLAIQN